MKILKEELITTRASELKLMIIDNLLDNGFVSYADILRLFNFQIDSSVPTACIDNEVVKVGTGFLDINDKFTREKCLNQLNVILRHELLHYLLQHINRSKKYLDKVIFARQKEEFKTNFGKELDEIYDKPLKDFPEDLQKAIVKAKIETVVFHSKTVDNTAADYEVSKYYDPEDIELIKNIYLNGEIVKGLVLELDRPSWVKLNYEQLLTELMKEHEKVINDLTDKYMQDKDNEKEIDVIKDVHSPDYVKAHNDAVSKYNSSKYSDEELYDIMNKLSQLEDGEEL